MARELVKTISRGKKNQFLNSNFRLAQRTGGSSTAISTGFAYLHDRWRTNSDDITSATHSSSSLPGGFPGDERIARCARVVGTSDNSNSKVIHQQRVESIRALEMKSNIISAGIWVYGDNFQEVRVIVTIPTAGADNYSTNTEILNTTIAIQTDTWQFISVENVDLTDRSNGYLVDFAFVNPSNTTGAFDTYMTQAMCNEGPVVESWSLAEGTEDLELEACQRYYEKSYNIDAAPGTGGSTGYCVYNVEVGNQSNPVANWSYKVRKRVNPTPQTYSPVTGASGALYRTETAADVSSFTFQGNQTGGGVGWSSNAAPQPLTYHWTADAEI